MTAQIEMKSWNADVSPAAAVMPGAMPRALSAMARTMTLAVTGVSMTGAVITGTATVAGTGPAVAGAMPGIVPAAVAGTIPAAMLGAAGVMIPRLHRGRGEDGEAGYDCQESYEPFHDALSWGLIRCRQMSGLFQQTRPRRKYSTTKHIFPFILI